MDKKYCLLARNILQTLHAYAKYSLPEVDFNNLFCRIIIIVFYFFTTLSTVARCFDGFCMRAKTEGFSKDEVYKTRCCA